jgi:rhamnosyltransferase
MPDSSVIYNIGSYISYLDRLYVVDNSPAGSGDHTHAIMSRYPESTILSGQGNKGIAKALNLALEKSFQNHADWLLTMDQDSSFENAQAERFFRSLRDIDQRSVAVVSPEHKKVHEATGYCRFREKTIVWTSGNLLNLAIVDKVGLFDERLFIDSVDHDFCLRVKLAGYKILQAENCYLNHTLGEAMIGRALCGLFNKKIAIHSPKRYYFILRNALYLSDRYRRDYPGFIKKLLKNTRKEMLEALLFTDRRYEYMRYAMRAYRDYRHGVYGNAVDL